MPERAHRAGGRAPGPAWRWRLPAAGGGMLLAPTVGAHAFGQRYDLPLPLSYFLVGGGLTVALSFAVVAAAARGEGRKREYPRFDLRRTAGGRTLSHPLTVGAVRALGVVLFLTVLVAGFYGVQNPFRNIVPTLVWIIGWIGLAYVCALFGDLWALLNPYRTLHRWAADIVRRLGGRPWPGRPLPEGVGVWPGVLLLLGLGWAEIVWQGNETPARVAALLLGYSILTFAGMALFGRETWLARGEVFSLFFGLFARFAPTEVRVRAPECCKTCGEVDCRLAPGDCVQCHDCLERAGAKEWEWNLRPWGAGLIPRAPMSASMTVFVTLALAIVTFDGVRETPFWEGILTWAFAPLQPVAGPKTDLLLTLGLLVTAAVFLVLYLGCCVLMARLVRGVLVAGMPATAWTLARFFVLSLLPIAIAYHLAHYLHYLLVAGQFVIPLASDPLGRGWDLFGTAGFRTDPALVGARFSWYTALVAIVIGHVIAMYVAHVTALRHFRERPLALRSQYPLAALMVAYTVLSLWILAQPVVEQVPHG